MAAPAKDDEKQAFFEEIKEDNPVSAFEQYEKRVTEISKNIKLPRETQNIISEAWKERRSEVHEHMKDTYPMVHGSVLSLAINFLRFKRQYGSAVEQAFYAQMNIVQLLDRIFTKRAVVFFRRDDSFTLRSGLGGRGTWEVIGTDQEKEDAYGRSLAEYMSYDEIMLSALCGVSSPTHFINDGNRYNNGKWSEDRVNDIPTYPMEAVYMGLVGARFEKPQRMEYTLAVCSEQQNRAENGYGPKQATDIKSVWAKFYRRQYLPTFEEAKEKAHQAGNTRYHADDYSGLLFDVDLFKQRIRVSLQLFLYDADTRGRVKKQNSYCFLVGLGAGYWAFNRVLQENAMVEVAMDIVASTKLANISCIYFSWFGDKVRELDMVQATLNAQNNRYAIQDKSGREIELQFGKANPADPLSGKFEKDLLCASYAWDGNSWPGNEYWQGMLNASGGPAAAACSTISFTQNSHVNRENVNGENVSLYFYDPATGEYEIKKIKDIAIAFDWKLGDNITQNVWYKKSQQSLPGVPKVPTK